MQGIDEFGRVGDDNEALGGRGDNLLAGVGAAAAFHEPAVGGYLVRAIDGDVETLDAREVLDSEAELARGVSVRGEVATHRMSSDRRARDGSKNATVEPVPSPTVMPWSTRSAAASAAARFSRWAFMTRSPYRCAAMSRGFACWVYFFSAWPPNSLRMADRILSVKSPRCRDSNRSNSDVVMTGAGTPSSTAARTVHRPSPESETRPLKLSRSGERASASAIRSDQPRPDHRSAPPHLGHLGDVDVVLIGPRVAQRGGLRVDGLGYLAGIGVLDDAEPLGDRGHHSVFDPVVHHLHEMPCAAGPAVQVPVGSGAARPVRPGVGSAWPSGGDRLEDRVEPGHDLGFPADHQAVAAFESPHPAAGAAVHVVNVLGDQPFGPGDVIAVIGVAAVDDRVAGLQQRESSSRVESTMAAGNINHTARGRSNLSTSSCSEVAPVAPSSSSCFTASGLTS